MQQRRIERTHRGLLDPDASGSVDINVQYHYLQRQRKKKNKYCQLMICGGLLHAFPICGRLSIIIITTATSSSIYLCTKDGAIYGGGSDR